LFSTILLQEIGVFLYKKHLLYKVFPGSAVNYKKLKVTGKSYRFSWLAVPRGRRPGIQILATVPYI
jgi:hypothetical protein